MTHRLPFCIAVGICLLLLGCQNSSSKNAEGLFSRGQLPNSSTSPSWNQDNMVSASYSDAIEDSAAAGSTRPNQQLGVDELLQAAHEASANGRLQEARSLYLQVLEYQPDHSTSHHRLAVIADNLQDYPTAERHYRLALAYAPTQPQIQAELYSDLGYSYLLQARFREAESHLQKSLEFNPAYAKALNNLGLLYGKQGNYEQALAMFRQSGAPEADVIANMQELFPNGPSGLNQQLARGGTGAVSGFPNSASPAPGAVSGAFAGTDSSLMTSGGIQQTARTGLDSFTAGNTGASLDETLPAYGENTLGPISQNSAGSSFGTSGQSRQLSAPFPPGTGRNYNNAPLNSGVPGSTATAEYSNQHYPSAAGYQDPQPRNSFSNLPGQTMPSSDPGSMGPGPQTAFPGNAFASPGSRDLPPDYSNEFGTHRNPLEVPSNGRPAMNGPALSNPLPGSPNYEGSPTAPSQPSYDPNGFGAANGNRFGGQPMQPDSRARSIQQAGYQQSGASPNGYTLPPGDMAVRGVATNENMGSGDPRYAQTAGTGFQQNAAMYAGMNAGGLFPVNPGQATHQTSEPSANVLQPPPLQHAGTDSRLGTQYTQPARSWGDQQLDPQTSGGIQDYQNQPRLGGPVRSLDSMQQPYPGQAAGSGPLQGNALADFEAELRRQNQGMNRSLQDISNQRYPGDYSPQTPSANYSTPAINPGPSGPVSNPY